MTTRNNNCPRSAFTLIELLVVIAIIGMLAGLIFSIAKGVNTTRNKSVTRGCISSMTTSLEAFKNTYHDYPMLTDGASDSESWQRAMHDALTGLKVLRKIDGQLRFIDFESAVTDKSKTPQRLSFVSGAGLREITPSGGVPNSETEAIFADAWDNPIEYRYNVISSNKPGLLWTNPTFLLISASGNFNGEKPVSADYFAGSMETTGDIPDDYFDDKYRSDNITNWKVE